MMPRRFGHGPGVIAPTPECTAAVDKMHKACSEIFSEISQALDAGKITEAQAEEKYTWAREQCEAAGAKVDDACADAGPWGPEDDAERPGFFTRVFHAAVGIEDPPVDPAAACADAGKEMTEKCGRSFSDIAADLDAGEITEAQAKEAFADAAVQCKKEGKRVADACAGPWAPPKERPSNFFAGLLVPRGPDGGPDDDGPDAPPGPGKKKKDPACKDAVAKAKAACKDPFAKIAADLAAGKISAAEAEKEFAAAAVGCKEAGAAMADACNPKGPK